MAKTATVKLDTLDFKESDVTNAKIVATGDDQLQFVGSGTEHINVTGAKIGLNSNVVNTSTHVITKDELVTRVTYTTTGACTVTLPSTSDAGSNVFHIIDAGQSASINNITVETAGSETINNESNAAITQNGQSFSLFCDGANWMLI